ncbi:reverse transcriptase domain-containing protein, partial [Tanacetum coccineum]
STKLSTDKDAEGTDGIDDDESKASTTTSSKSSFKRKEKGVELRDVEDTERPRTTSTRSILTLKPLPKIDPKDKGKKMTEDEESDSESDGINETEKKFKQLAHNEEIARKMQEEWEVVEEKNRLAKEKAINAALVQELDDVKARIEADRLLALRLQEEEREQFTIEERAKFLHDTIAAQRRFLAEQRSAHVGGNKHVDLKNRNFDEIQDLYERIKRSNDKFLAGSAKDEEKSTKKKDEEVPAKQVDEDVDELKLSLVIAPDEDKEVDYEILDRKYPIVKWKSEFITTKPQHDESKEVEEVNLNVVIRSNGQRRHFSTLMRVLSVFDREDLNAIYHLVVNRYSNDIPKGFDRILWGDLMIMFNQGDADEFWNTQQDWKIVCWKLHNSSGVHTLMTEKGLVIHMLVENKYPLKKEVLLQMLKLKLESKEDSTMTLELIRFVKKQIAKLELDKSDGDEKHKNWLVHKQTACGKDFSNPFMVDNLPKIVGFSTHLASLVKSWLVQDQTVLALASPKANGIWKLNEATRKDHFPLPFMDQMLERLAGNEFYCFLDGFSRYFQIPIDPHDQEKMTFTCPYGTFAYRRMPFGLCNAPGTFQRCMMAIFHDMIEKTMEVFMDDFSVFGDSFDSCLSNLERMLKRCEDTNLVLNWEKCHFMCKEGIVLGHKISKSGIEVDRAKVDVIAKLPHPTTVKGVRSFLGHAGFYRRFIQDFSKISRPITHLLEKDTPFVFSQDCINAFETLKKELTRSTYR